MARWGGSQAPLAAAIADAARDVIDPTPPTKTTAFDPPSHDTRSDGSAGAKPSTSTRMPPAAAEAGPAARASGQSAPVATHVVARDNPSVTAALATGRE